MRAAIKYGMTVTEFYDSTDRDIYNFITARIEKLDDEVQQQYENTRLIMWASIAAMNGNKLKPEQILKLKRDKVDAEISGWTKQEVAKWNKLMDEGPMPIIPK